jgi:hypothetical protein
MQNICCLVFLCVKLMSLSQKYPVEGLVTHLLQVGRAQQVRHDWLMAFCSLSLGLIEGPWTLKSAPQMDTRTL